jgi:hypothetical protein
MTNELASSIPADYVSRDVAGNPRVSGAGWDLGAYER